MIVSRVEAFATEFTDSGSFDGKQITNLKIIIPFAHLTPNC